MDTGEDASANLPQDSLPIWKRLLFGGVLVFLVLGSLELASQIYLRAVRGYDGTSFLQYQFDPYKNIHPFPGWRDTRGVTHNANGFRRAGEIAREKPAETYRIFLMGASTAYGTGGLWPHIQTDFAVLDNAETIDAYLEHILAQELSGYEVEVINAAIPSTWTHHHLIYLNQDILRFDPDLILFLDGLNDHFYYNLDHHQFQAYAYNEQAWTIMGPPTLRSLVRMNGWWVFRRSAFAHVSVRALEDLRTILRGRPDLGAIEVNSALDRLDAVFRNNALKMIERSALLLQHEGIPAIFMLQPMLVLEGERLGLMPEVEREMFEFNLTANPANYEEYIARAVPLVGSAIDEVVAPRGAQFLDLTDAFRGQSTQMFTDYAHLTPAANRLIAEIIAGRIVTMR